MPDINARMAQWNEANFAQNTDEIAPALKIETAAPIQKSEPSANPDVVNRAKKYVTSFRKSNFDIAERVNAWNSVERSPPSAIYIALKKSSPFAKAADDSYTIEKLRDLGAVKLEKLAIELMDELDKRGISDDKQEPSEESDDFPSDSMEDDKNE